jgi:hypothetical protein
MTEESHLPRQEDIRAAIAAHNGDDREPTLPPEAVRLLAVMFTDADICQRPLDSLVGERFSRRRILRLLDMLVEAGFLTKQSRVGQGPNTYHLHLPPRRQP